MSVTGFYKPSEDKAGTRPSCGGALSNTNEYLRTDMVTERLYWCYAEFKPVEN